MTIRQMKNSQQRGAAKIRGGDCQRELPDFFFNSAAPRFIASPREM